MTKIEIEVPDGQVPRALAMLHEQLPFGSRILPDSGKREESDDSDDPPPSSKPEPPRRKR